MSKSKVGNWAFSILCTAALAGCGGAGGAGGSVIINPPPGGIAVSISPQNASVSANGQLLFSANVSGTNDHRVAWSSSGLGSIDQNGLFTASNQQGSATVYATSVAQPSITASANVTVASTPDPWVFWPVNGHYYRVVIDHTRITWSQARAQALAQGADLVCISNQAENDFVFSLITDPSIWDLQEDTGITFGPWIGFHQSTGSQEPAGGWGWVSGEPVSFVAWEANQPDNGGGIENSAHYAYMPGSPAPTWQDFPDSNSFPGGLAYVHGYVMERPVVPDPWVYWPVNGHRYRAFSVPSGITWTEAEHAAEAVGGHLATITSQAENDFVFGLVDDPKYWNQRPPGNPGFLGPWLGARAPLGRPDPTMGWTWVTGEPWTFTNWQTSEPSSSGEDSLQFISTHAGQRTSQWNDLIGDSLDFWNTPVVGYIVEID